jgi:type II secretory ATPase GspE/PulE/Tfp pilus assembly ATPase PilB-like protein
MSDLSQPPLNLVPLADEPVGAVDAAPRPEPFAWPTPPLACYPQPMCPLVPEPCEVEGLNGKSMPGRLAAFLPDDGRLQLQVPNMRAPLTLRLSQFRRLVLTQPLAPLPGTDCGDAAQALDERPALPYRLDMCDGDALEGRTIGHLEDPIGLFLFEPVDPMGRVRRVFVPRSAYRHLELGPRLGDVLLEHQVTTPGALDDALQTQAEMRSRRIGDVLLLRKIVTADQLADALEQQSHMPMVRIGEALVAMGYVDELQLTEALEQQRGERGMPLGELLVRQGVVTRSELQMALARKMGYPMVDLKAFPFDAEAIARIPFPVAHRREVLPLMLRGGRLVVAIADPTRRDALEEIEFVAQMKIVPVLADPLEVPGAIDRAYDRLGIGAWLPAEELRLDPEPAAVKDVLDARGLLASLEQQDAEGPRPEVEDAQIEQSDNSLVKLMHKMILEAQAQSVSDIHIECPGGRDKVRIRFRKDGQLRPYLELPHTYRSAVIARLKIMCDLDISERRKPQDGKINFGKFHTGSKLELRLATIPTQNNLEDAVLRLLSSARPLPLEQLSFSEHNLAGLKSAMKRPYGMVLCVGPTGSGKTTTLHSAMAFINTPDRKIWTAEDPVEITQPGLRQVQVNPRIDWTFAKALRAFLRADPDVIMVGEIRDQETAQVAIEASLTGHLVLSTLHTNSAAETVTRLLDMGMDPFNFADSLLAVVAQRLVRRLCAKCVQSRPATPAELDELAEDWLHACIGTAHRPTHDEVLAGWSQRHAKDGRLQFHHAPGCGACEHTGFKGRAALHELLSVSRPIKRQIQTGARAEEILGTAMDEGLRTLRQDGIEKVLAGLTTIEEVRAGSNT